MRRKEKLEAKKRKRKKILIIKKNDIDVNGSE